jgi:surface carbohydrate biosynthesis protein
MNIYIKIEIKSRELEARLLLAMTAAEKGHEVLLGSSPLTLDLVQKKILKPGIILEKSITPSKERISQLKNYKDYHCKTTSIDEEGGFIDNDFHEFLEQRFSKKSVKLTDKIFTWGMRDYKKLSSHFNIYKSKFSVTGNSRVDFWRQDFNEYYKKQNLSKIKSNDKFILLASNFGAMVHQQRIWQDIKLARKNQYFERGYDEFSHYEYQSYQIRLAAKFVKAMIKISQNFKDLKIVIRPHPNESIEAWKAIVGPHKNILVIHDGSIGKWIRKAKLVIHNSCTSGIESYASNIPTIAYRPLKSNFERKFPNSLSINIFDEKNLIKKIKDILNKENNLKKKSNQKLENYFYNLKNKLASENIVKEWEKLDNGKLSQKNNLLKLKIIANIKEFRGKISLRNLLNLDKKIYFDRSAYKFKKITNNEIQTISSNLKKSLNRFENVTVKKLSDRLILVKNK